MSTDQRNPISVPNGNNLTATSMFCGVTIDAAGNAALPTAGGSIIGAMYGLSGTLTAISVRTPGDGTVKAQYGAAVTIPAVLKMNASGQFITANAADIAAGAAVAIAMESGILNEVHPVVLIGGASPQAQITGTETITSGAASLATLDTLLSTTATIAYTLANGIYAGQTKRFREITAASTPLGTLTIATPFGSEPATHVFTGTGQEIVFEWTGAAWRTISKIRAGAETVVVGTTVLTGHDMCLVYNLSVTATVTSVTGPLSIPSCYLTGDMCIVRTTVAASSPVGTINIAGFTKAEVAATNLNTINATSCSAQFIGGADGWHNVNVTTAVYA